MGTRSKTTVFDSNNKPLLSFYRQMDGYYEGHGKELQEFLSEMVITNGICLTDGKKTANGMGCLAAQLVKHFKEDVGGIYICQHTDEQEYNYFVRVKDGKLSLVGTSEHEKPMNFELYDALADSPKRIVSFVYDKQDGSSPTWRDLEVTDEDCSAICGVETYPNSGGYKRFLKSKIVGGKIIEVKT